MNYKTSIPAHLFIVIMILTGSGLLFAARGKAFKSSSFSATADSIPHKYQGELKALEAQFKEIGFDINPLLNDNRFMIYEGIDERFEGSAEKTSFSIKEYEDILGFEYKAAKIDEFIDEHYETLKKAEAKYGISKFIIAAILGIESNFGENIGSHNPFNAYASMIILDYRADFAQAQLKHLLMFTQRENIDVLSLKSSYAGAMGYAQFIPYSLNKWWIGDELFNMENNIYSVANYLAYFKERVGDIETAVLRYNPSSLYVKAVMHLAEVAKENF